MTVESPTDREPISFTPLEAERFLSKWYRVVGEFAETVAYVPNEAIANEIVKAANGEHERTVQKCVVTRGPGACSLVIRTKDQYV